MKAVWQGDGIRLSLRTFLRLGIGVAMPPPVVLHYLGYSSDDGGIVSVVRALAGADRFACVLGLNRGAQQRRAPALPAVELPPLTGETLGLRTFWRARAVAREVGAWLRAEPGRVFHGHSRAGLAVALWLARAGERRAVVSVHCYGRQRWFYRWAARRLEDRLYWLSPAMKEYYGVPTGAGPWARCIPGCVPELATSVEPRSAHRESVVQIGGIGLLVPWKRWHLVLEALALVPEPTRRRMHFRHIGGTGGSPVAQRYAAELQARTSDLGLATTVTWLGAQPSSGPFLREIDCLVIPARREPFSIAMLEALQAGIPVLAADSGGARDVIVPSRNGWLFHSGDAADLARTLAMLAESDGLGGVQIAGADLQRFKASVVAEQWAGVYERLLLGIAQRSDEGGAE
jgi:glycosyltransferase involved in cell wall biosynthesis